MKQHFVTFYSPGTFVHEETTKPIKKWDPALAKKMAKNVVERYNSTPFCFVFTTRERKAKDLDSKEVARSGRYYLGGKIETLADVEARATKEDDTLLWNMRHNGKHMERIITNTNSWKSTHVFGKDDVLLEWP